MNYHTQTTATHEQAEPVIPFEFTGKGAKFFRIWIVNTFLTIITLGIYSAWAKVRTYNYFYGNTWLDGNAFSYLASPITILKGRLAAVALLAVYGLINQFYPLLGLLLLGLLLVLLPWLINRSLRFNAINSAYRNVRFNFTGAWLGAALAFLVWPLFGLFTLFLLLPISIRKQKEYYVNHHAYGVSNFAFEARNGPFYLAFFGSIGIVILAGCAAFSLLVASPITAALIFAMGYVAGFAFYQALTFNIVFQGSRLDQHRFEANMTALGYTRLVSVNLVCMVLTLGLFYPFAKVRTARYKAGHLALRPTGPLDSYVASETEKLSALGDELAGAMDLDFGL